MKPILRQHIVLFLLLVVCGCGDERSESFSDMRERLSDKIDKEYAERQSTVSQEARRKLPAKSVEDLVEAYELAFNAGDFQAIKQMAHTENVSDDLEEKTLTWVLSSRSAGKNTIQEFSIRPLEPSDQRENWSLEPVSIFECRYRANDDSGSGGTEAPIVAVNERYYFYVFARPFE